MKPALKFYSEQEADTSLEFSTPDNGTTYHLFVEEEDTDAPLLSFEASAAEWKEILKRLSNFINSIESQSKQNG